MIPEPTPPSPDHNPPTRSVYLNPVPAAVALVPVLASDPATGRKGLGLLTIERGSAPQIGRLALPGGYIEQGEDWRAALLRELHEETSIRIDDITCVTLKAAHSIDKNRKIVLFGSVPVVEESQLANFVSHRECPRYEIIFQPRELAFDTHTTMALQFFNCMWMDYSSVLNQLEFPRGFRCSEK
jgi:8-oxo-dGTP diphosphatase